MSIATRLSAKHDAKLQYPRLHGTESAENRIQHESINFAEIIINRYTYVHTLASYSTLQTSEKPLFLEKTISDPPPSTDARGHGACAERVHACMCMRPNQTDAENASKPTQTMHHNLNRARRTSHFDEFMIKL